MSTSRIFDCDVCGFKSEPFYLAVGKPVGWGTLTWFVEGVYEPKKPPPPPQIESLMDVCPSCMKSALGAVGK